MGVINKNSGTCLVSWDFSHGDSGVLIVGVKRPNESIEIINAFQGEEARGLAEKLITQNTQK